MKLPKITKADVRLFLSQFAPMVAVTLGAALAIVGAGAALAWLVLYLTEK